ncbi:MAG: dTDP-4-amino-4,6-dideoxygalactose transaminase [Bacteroidetes bacterium]|nr:MAG: dTDP-4-amino-4,6-dideoxygalactose transaminase [Bacteroidota bacterium]TAG85563.1 MAG: dTDP-4-amino-4,6-dideoxygalactose transaminase [Bacteroidota bacterium]
MQIPFNKPYLSGKETHYISEAVLSGKISGDGIFTKKCHQFFEQKYGFKKCLLTTSCTDALEMCAILLDIKEGDEIIAPSYTFVSTVNAFVLRGAKIIFIDSETYTPNIDTEAIEELITPKTKAIIAVHYAGIACDMDKIMILAEKYNLYVVEDAAQAIDSFYKDKPLGSIGHLSAFSFHETKNIIAGEGGMLVINDEKFIKRAEIIREKGTNRSAFFRGEVDKYGWLDIGSSFLPSDIIAAFLYAQLENLNTIQLRREEIWKNYYNDLQILEQKKKLFLPIIPEYATNNAHIFYILCKDLEERTQLVQFLKEKGIMAVFHYLSLHKSSFYQSKYNGKNLPQSDYYTDCLLRLPFYYELTKEQQDFIIKNIFEFYGL